MPQSVATQPSIATKLRARRARTLRLPHHSQFILLPIVVFVGLLWLANYADTVRNQIAGRQATEQDWQAGRPYLHISHSPDHKVQLGGCTIWHKYDPASGLCLSFKTHCGDAAREASYQSRLLELLEEHGPPPWSHRRFIVPAEDVIKIFNKSTDDRFRVTSLPYRINGNILLRNGESGSEGNFYLLDDRIFTLTNGQAAFVTTDDRYPDTFFICIGTDKLYIVSAAGKIISIAYRDG